MDPSQKSPDRTANRLALYQQHLSAPHSNQPPTMAARDPITCHCLNTLTGTPAANLPVTLTLLSTPAGPSSPVTFHATTNADGRVAKWTPAGGATASTSSVPDILAALPTAESKTNWSVRFDVGPWYEAQGIESFWPEVEVKFTVKGRGRDGEEGWRHYHVPVLLGPWNYSTYRGS
ncbi:Hydroxyisourate hydrolase [Penicillium pulvis]|uniref:Hydroxyisourate hydrolase n=1 Tax=Penicillium pulvis TaxID=1562058 RepID=UPI002549A642|nr:Hydroxyisourate hydrolase [Penicillium pulvis]KAJ5792850.1 Hydroxyisourate hydrolase [Penicillium pulvis]